MRLPRRAPVDHAEAELEKLKRQAAAKRNAYTEAKAALDGIERDIRGRQYRLKSINEERAALAAAHEERERANGEPGRAPRRHQKPSLLRSASCPAKIAERRAKILNEIGQAETARKAAADKLAEATNALREADKVLREAQSGLSSARETRARIEARLEAARERRTEYATMIRENFECQPEDVLEERRPGGCRQSARCPRYRADRS